MFLRHVTVVKRNHNHHVSKRYLKSKTRLVNAGKKGSKTEHNV
jgi:hypothetical protein